MDDLLQEFIAETRETLEAIAGEIVAWEADPTDRARLDAIFRFVHTVKGSCGFLDLPRLARLSHAAEDVLADVRDGKRPADTALVSAVLAIVDRIGEIVEAIDAGTSLPDAGEEGLIAALAADAAPAIAIVPQPTVHRAANRSVRLGIDLLDRMMSGMSDMVLARNELARRLRDEAVDPRIEAALERLSLTVSDMRDTVTRTRMQKVEALFSAVPRMVRDTATDLHKSVALTVEGADVELDREMIEMLRDPLVHIVRNAIDHGIESPAERRAAGKPETGRLVVSARQSGNQILIDIADDGRGIDVARLAAKAVAQGLRSEAAVAAMRPAERLDLIFLPGLSSRDAVTATSGRGVGMDVVRANIEQIGGRVLIDNRAGRGLTLTIQVPLTLSIISTIVVGVGAERFAMPRQTIEEIVMLRGQAVRLDMLGDAEVVSVRGRRLPLVRLGALLGIAGGRADTLAIVGTRDGDYALAVDAVLDTEELVVKPAAPIVMATGIYGGQTLPDNGMPMLLLDTTGIAAVAGLRFQVRAPAPLENADAAEEPGTPALLFMDRDHHKRAIPLAVVDRVETVPVEAIREVGGRLRLTIDGAILALHSIGPIDTFGGARTVPVLRLTDGVGEMAYAIAEAMDIVTLPHDRAAAHGAGPIAGVVLIDGEPIEVVDAHALFAGQVAVPVAVPVCLLQCDGSGWMEAFLRPTLEASGYRCVTRLAPGDVPAAILAMEDAPVTASAPVVRLRRDVAGGTGSIYRYDRAALIAAIGLYTGMGGR